MVDAFFRKLKSQRWNQLSRIHGKSLQDNYIWLAAQLDLNEFCCCKKLDNQTSRKYGRSEKNFEQSSACFKKRKAHQLRASNSA